MKKVFVVQHERKKDEDNEDIKLIGIYSSEQKAKEAINRLKKQRGFRDNLNGFFIDEYIINTDHWTEGFGH